MVEPFDARGDEPTPPHDPWAPTERVAATPAPPAPPATSVPPATPPAPAYPPTRQYPYPGLIGNAAPGGPMAPGGLAASEPVLLSIGEIQVTATTIRTPAGVYPLRGSQWTISDSWTTTQKIPTWAIVLAVVGFFCLTFFSLLFLLAKENVHQAVVLVQVVSNGQQYVARIPANDPAQVQYLYQQVNYVRSLATM
jgi:hypothetical protein